MSRLPEAGFAEAQRLEKKQWRLEGFVKKFNYLPFVAVLWEIFGDCANKK